MHTSHPGLRKLWVPFAWLVVINGFVGAVVGVERSILPLLAQEKYGLSSATGLLSFVAAFGAAKAIANAFAGGLSDRFGRRPVLLAGWLLGLPVPFLLAWAPTWGWVSAANVLLGFQQGLAWSAAVLMKIDLAGPRRRGLAMGFNEAAGYGAVALAAMAGSYVAARYSVDGAPFVLMGIFFVAGLVLSLWKADETVEWGRREAHPAQSEETVSFREAFLRTTWTNPHLRACTQAGLVNNLNDGIAWGLLPVVFVSAGMSLGQVGLLAGLYPAVWGLGQLATGGLSDRWGRRPFLVIGMMVQAVGLALMPLHTFAAFASGMVLLGLGTAMVYPTLIAAVSDLSAPSWRGKAVGTYRFWRDSGYVAGALLGGLVADGLGLTPAILLTAALTAASGVWARRG